MKIKLFIVLLFIFTSCQLNEAPEGMTYLITLPDGNVVECKEYRDMNSKDADFIEARYFYGNGKVSIKTVPYEPNLLYNLGYKQGQIDALEGKGCYAKVLTNDGEVLWKDTCSVKRKPRL